MKKTLFYITMVFFVAVPCFAANVTTMGAGVIHIVLDGSSDWNYVDDAGFLANMGVKVTGIQFNPSAANDRLIIRERTATGTIIHDSNPVGGTSPWYDPMDPPKWEYPYIDATDLVLGTPANASVIIRYE